MKRGLAASQQSESAIENGNIEAVGCLINMSEMRCERDHVLDVLRRMKCDSCALLYRES